ncbi:MAG: hypothetical protein ACKVQR_05410 [Aquabacterium sp.]
MQSTFVTRLFSIVLAAGFTLAILGSIDQLARNDSGQVQLAQAGQPRA